MERNKVLKVLPGSVRLLIEKENLQYEYLQEIKLRTGQPLILKYKGNEIIPGKQRNVLYIVFSSRCQGNDGLCQQLFVVCV